MEEEVRIDDVEVIGTEEPTVEDDGVCISCEG